MITVVSTSRQPPSFTASRDHRIEAIRTEVFFRREHRPLITVLGMDSRTRLARDRSKQNLHLPLFVLVYFIISLSDEEVAQFLKEIREPCLERSADANFVSGLRLLVEHASLFYICYAKKWNISINCFIELPRSRQGRCCRHRHRRRHRPRRRYFASN